LNTFKIRATGKEINLTDKQLEKLYFNWSVDKVKDFLFCPFYFYLKRIIRLPWKRGVNINPQPLFVFEKVLKEVLARFFAPRMKNGFKSPETMANLFSALWINLARGENFAGLDMDWPWERINFENEGQLEILRQRGMYFCRNFWRQNIHYFRDLSMNRPLVKECFSNYLFVQRKKFQLSAVIDRIENPTGSGVYLIDYQTGLIKRDSYFKENDFSFMAYQWLYSKAFKQRNESAKFPLKGMGIYSLEKINHCQRGSVTDWDKISLKPTGSNLLVLKNSLAEIKRQLEFYLNQGDFPINPGLVCRMCPFGEQCQRYCEKNSSLSEQERIMNKKNIAFQSFSSGQFSNPDQLSLKLD
jgi:RecB family exonuclease